MHSSSSAPLGLIAGKGTLPAEIIRACAKSGRPLSIVAIQGEILVDEVANHPHHVAGIGSVGKILKVFKKAGVQDIVLAGAVTRPSFSSLKLDWGGVKLLARILKHRAQGDNILFETIIGYLQDAGFCLKGADEVCGDLLAPEGVLGIIPPDETALQDITIGVQVAKTLGALDVGQAAIVQQGVVIAVEGREGTDGLLSRIAPLMLKGKGGVLVKVKKPDQDSRIDLPTIGLSTIENSHKAGLRGIAVEAGAALILGREGVIARANSLEMFVVGVKAE